MARKVEIEVELSGNGNSHPSLIGRALPQQHPISAITNLTENLASKDAKDIELQEGIDEVTGSLTTHISNINNPHEVTKAQVGLANCDNTSDLQKPISTATQTALNTKQDILTAGYNIQITNNTISATDTIYTAGTGISISSENVISSTQTSTQWGNITGTLSNQTDLQNILNNKVNKNSDIVASTKAKVTYDNKGLVTGGQDLVESDIPNLHLSKITDITASATELNYVDGVTSSIQSQLDSKEGTLILLTNMEIDALFR